MQRVDVLRVAGKGDVGVEISLVAILAVFCVCLAVIAWIFKTG